MIDRLVQEASKISDLTVMALPLDIAFPWWQPSILYKILGKTVDCLFLCDMAIHFNTGVVSGDHVIHDRKGIAHHYA